MSLGSSGDVSPVSTISGPQRPSPIHFDDVEVPDVLHDLTTAIHSTFGRHVTLTRDPPAAQGHPKVTPVDQGQGHRNVTSVDQVQGRRNVLEELSDRLQQGRKSRDPPMTSRDNDVIKSGVDAGRYGNNVRSSDKYPLLVSNFYLLVIWTVLFRVLY